jgi:hypothetical protein
MVEFTIQVEDRVVQTLGHKQIERSLHELMHTILLRLSAQDILNDVETIDLENDTEWQVSRNLA